MEYAFGRVLNPLGACRIRRISKLSSKTYQKTSTKSYQRSHQTKTYSTKQQYHTKTHLRKADTATSWNTTQHTKTQTPTPQTTNAREKDTSHGIKGCLWRGAEVTGIWYNPPYQPQHHNKHWKEIPRHNRHMLPTHTQTTQTLEQAAITYHPTIGK